MRAASRASTPLIGMWACTMSGRSARNSATMAHSARHCARGDRLRAIGKGATRSPAASTSASSGPSAQTPSTSCPRACAARISGNRKCRSEKSTLVTSTTFTPPL